MKRLNNYTGFSLVELMVALAIGSAVVFMSMDALQQFYRFQKQFEDAETLATFEMEMTHALNVGTACLDTITSGGTTAITNSTFANGGTYSLSQLAVAPHSYKIGDLIAQTFILKKILLSNEGPSGEISKLTAGTITELWLHLEFSYKTGGSIVPNLTRVIPIAVNINGAVPPAVEGCTSFESKDLISFVCGDLGAVPNSQYNSCDFKNHTSVLQDPICDAVTHSSVGKDLRCH